MSDYISKNVTMQRFQKEIKQSRRDLIHINTIKRLLDDVETVDEKEIIRKKMERIIYRIEKARQKYQRLVKEQGKKEDEAMNIHFRGVMQIVKEEGGIE